MLLTLLQIYTILKFFSVDWLNPIKKIGIKIKFLAFYVFFFFFFF